LIPKIQVLRILSGQGPVLRILQAGRSPDAEEGLDAEKSMIFSRR